MIWTSGDVGASLDYEYGIIARSGLHCAPLAHQTIGTLEEGAVRLSPGYFTTREQIEYLIKAIHPLPGIRGEKWKQPHFLRGCPFPFPLWNKIHLSWLQIMFHSKIRG